MMMILICLVLTMTTIGAHAERGPGAHGGGMGGRGGMGGGMTTETDETVLSEMAEGAAKFTQDSFTDPDSSYNLEYSVFIPDDTSTVLPLVIYIPDSSAVGSSAAQIVARYYGGDSFVTDAQQAAHPCYVIVPAFTETVTQDDWTTSDQINTLVKLIDDFTASHAVDTNRLYITGQSMGCMTSLYLNSIYPDKFAATLYVSGQWDINVLQGMEKQKFFYIVAGGDEKASAGQAEVIAMFDADSVPYTFAEWDAQNDADIQNADLKALADQDLNANFVLFTTGTVLNGGSGMEHMASFNYAYKISAVHDWLFAQVKGEP